MERARRRITVDIERRVPIVVGEGLLLAVFEALDWERADNRRLRAELAQVRPAAPRPQVSRSSVVAVLRRAGDLVDEQPYGHADVLGAIAQAAAEHTDRIDHAEQLGNAVLAVIAEFLDADGAETVRQWSQARPHEVVVAFLRAAATAHEQRAGGSA